MHPFECVASYWCIRSNLDYIRVFFTTWYVTMGTHTFLFPSITLLIFHLFWCWEDIKEWICNQWNIPDGEADAHVQIMSSEIMMGTCGQQKERLSTRSTDWCRSRQQGFHHLGSGGSIETETLRYPDAQASTSLLVQVWLKWCCQESGVQVGRRLLVNFSFYS